MALVMALSQPYLNASLMLEHYYCVIVFNEIFKSLTRFIFLNSLFCLQFYYYIATGWKSCLTASNSHDHFLRICLPP